MIAFAAQPILTLTLGDLIPSPIPGRVAVVWPSGSDTVLSVQPDGSYQKRPKGSIGPWESAVQKGDKLVFQPDGHIYVVPFIDGL